MPVCDVISEKRNDTKVRIDFAMLPILEKVEKEGLQQAQGLQQCRGRWGGWCNRQMPLVCLSLCGSDDSDNKFKHFAALQAIHSRFLPSYLPPLPLSLSLTLVLSSRARFACVLIVNLHFAVFIATL